jgi:hypothetical protein
MKYLARIIRSITRQYAAMAAIPPNQAANAGSSVNSDATFAFRTTASFVTGAGAQTGTLTNAPAAGNPTKWIAIDDNGTTRFIPAW